jgi:hypothetical protein
VPVAKVFRAAIFSCACVCNAFSSSCAFADLALGFALQNLSNASMAAFRGGVMWVSASTLMPLATATFLVLSQVFLFQPGVSGWKLPAGAAMPSACGSSAIQPQAV